MAIEKLSCTDSKIEALKKINAIVEDSDNKVSKSGDTMTGPLVVSSETSDTGQRNLIVRIPEIDFATAPTATMYPSIEFQDNSGNRMGRVEYTYRTDGSHHIAILDKKDKDTATYATVSVGFDVNGKAVCNFPKCTTKATTTSTASSSNVAVVVQNYKSGATWYRVWSDGWIEQGGSTGSITSHATKKITFSKPFVDTNCTILFSQGGWNDGYERSDTGITAITKTDFTVGSTSGCTSSGRWYACGY